MAEQGGCHHNPHRLWYCKGPLAALSAAFVDHNKAAMKHMRYATMTSANAWMMYKSWLLVCFGALAHDAVIYSILRLTARGGQCILLRGYGVGGKRGCCLAMVAP